MTLPTRLLSPRVFVMILAPATPATAPSPAPKIFTDEPATSRPAKLVPTDLTATLLPAPLNLLFSRTLIKNTM